MSDAEQPDDFDGLTYEQLVEALEMLTNRMAAGDIGIEEVADLYERAGRLHAAASDRLAQVRARIEALSEDDGPATGG
jgi:exodeoxyribonuclease VII small subunit